LPLTKEEVKVEVTHDEGRQMEEVNEALAQVGV
jgi:hypothetical protein